MLYILVIIIPNKIYYYRGVHTTGFTGAHVDRVYMGWGTEELFTMWTPMDDIPVEMGTLAVCEGSHNLQRLLSSVCRAGTKC